MKSLLNTFFVLLVTILISSCSSQQPSWQVIGEGLRSYVTCEDIKPDNEGNPVYGFGPCVKLTDVIYDRTMGDSYCFNTSPMVGGYSGESYEDISDWEFLPDKYFCVTWNARYVDSDPSEPSDWRINFPGAQPNDLLP